MSSLYVTNVRLPPPPLLRLTGETNDLDKTWTVKCSEGMVTSVSQMDDSDQGVHMASGVQVIDAGGSIMLPSCVLSPSRLNNAINYDSCS